MMLVLSRKIGERVLIADAEGREICWVAVVSIDHSKVRLGFQASPDVKFSREELLRDGEEKV